MTSSRKDILAVLAFLGLLVFFYPGLFLVTSAPLIGDSLEQHYPWAFQLAQSLKELRLPFWTPLIQCGFPLVAESQVGAFYLPNLILLGLLPFHVAYSFMNVFHWFIAGWGTYAYAKQIKLGVMASFVAALIFVFGGAYGGAYYNMTSLKTICWFPVALYLLERYLDRRQVSLLCLMAVVISQSLVAGYLQMAVLTWMIFGAYAILRIFILSEKPMSFNLKLWSVVPLSLTAFGALLLALPQIYLTFKLALLSNRAGLEEGYAYLGSMSPLVLASLTLPKLSLLLRGNNLYSGAFGLFLVLFVMSSPDLKKDKTFRLWASITILAILLALGRWSPLYVALIKITKFYSFRFPAKFIGFICFGVAMMSAIGFQALWQGSGSRLAIKKALRSYLAIVAFCSGLMVAGNLLMTAWKDFAIKLGEFFVMQFVYGKPGHPHSLESYLAVVKSYPDTIRNYISLSDPANLWMFGISCFCVVLVLALLRKNACTRSLLGVAVFFLTVDLYAASFLDIQLDLAPYAKIQGASSIQKIVGGERSAGDLGRIYGFRTAEKPLPLAPSQNMLFGLSDIGAYSPLVLKRYNESIGLLGNVNDSNFQRFPTTKYVLERLALLGFLNVSHIISTNPIEHADLQQIGSPEQQSGYLYRNMGIHHPAYFISNVQSFESWNELLQLLMAPQFNPRETLLIEKSELRKIRLTDQHLELAPQSSVKLLKQNQGQESWLVETSQPGFLVIPETFYPGWIATANGRPTPILKGDGLFRAIWLDSPGTYKIQFSYNPFLQDQ